MSKTSTTKLMNYQEFLRLSEAVQFLLSDLEEYYLQKACNELMGKSPGLKDDGLFHRWKAIFPDGSKEEWAGFERQAICNVADKITSKARQLE